MGECIFRAAMESPPPSTAPRTRSPTPVPALFRVAIAPLRAFFQLQTSSGILLALCAVLAMAWANSPWAASYEGLFDARLSFGAASTHHATFTVRQLINDGLMTLFFFLVGMEVKRELSAGELSSPARAVLPLIAALGGMVAFGDQPAVLNEAKLGIVVGSLLSALVGYVLLRFVAKPAVAV